MKRLNLLIVCFLIGISGIFAQSGGGFIVEKGGKGDAGVPQAINFQAIARDASGEVMVNTQVMVQLSILDGSATGKLVYKESRSLKTNAFGSFSFQIGIEPYMKEGDFSTIDWASSQKYLKVDFDPTNTLTFDLTLGTIAFSSVPYAFAAGAVAYIDIDGVKDGDILVYNSTSGKFEPQAPGAGQADWNSMLNKPVLFSGSWNDLTNKPDMSTYLTSFTEVDGSVTNEIQSLSLSGNTLSLSNGGGSVTLAAGTAYTAGTGISISGGVISNTSTDTDDQTLTEILTANNNAGNKAIVNTSKIGIGTATPVASAVLELNSTTGGFLPPVMSQTQRDAITSPAAGLQVFNSTTGKPNYYNGTTWMNFDGTSAATGGGTTVTDYDGNVYNTVTIGTQTWMKENLKVTKYANGTAIPLVTDPTAWANLGDNDTDKGYCYYNNNSGGEKDTYGALYTYAAATNGDNDGTTQGVCPTGWHLPSDAEWKTLEKYLGMSQFDADQTGWRGTDEGSKLAGNVGAWADGVLDQNANFDASGFTAFPSGYRGGSDGNFSSLGYSTLFWSASEYDATGAWLRYLYTDDSAVFRNFSDKSAGFSVRCVRDN